MDTNVNKNKALTVIADIVFWILSIFVLIFSLGAFATKEGMVGGIILVVTAVIINPIIYKLISRKVSCYKRWLCLVICLLGFFVGIFSLPATPNVDGGKEIAKTETIQSDEKVKDNSKGDTKQETAKTNEDVTKEKDSSNTSKDAFDKKVVNGELPEIDNGIVEKMTEAGYSLEHATEIQRILNTCGITSLEIYFQTGEAENGLNAMSCYANGSKEDQSRFTVSTEDGVVFYVGFLSEDLYDIDKGGFLKKYTDVHIPETKVDMNTYTTLQSLAVEAVKSCLNYPNTADFKELYWGVGRSDDNYKIIGRVNAKNGFGVDSDINFGVWFKKVNNKFIIEGVTLDGIRVK